tara:strand:- start:796 stop:2031 length:1236 start_codon:yes stop_codon:yes gene_type:complete
MHFNNKQKIAPCVIGLGYVGLPVFVRLKKKFNSIAFDNNIKRINQLKKLYDVNKEHTKKDLKIINKSTYSSNKKNLLKSNFYIVTVPTPIDKKKIPELSSLINVSKIIAKNLNIGDIIVFESTVYPGATNMIIETVLNKNSKLIEGKDYFVAYSPERINPGDKKHNIYNVKKILAINTKNSKIISKIKYVYKQITKNIVITNSIEYAEMAKVVENTQRDINIAFMNDIFIFSKKMNYDLKKILKLASTKWNFINLSPGLVGGHCLPVDPYYLNFIAKKNNINLKTVQASRKVNESMEVMLTKIISDKIKKNKYKNKILISGITYKKNVPDTRNSIPLNIYLNLKKKYKSLIALDNYCELKNKKRLKIFNSFNDIKEKVDLVIFLVDHNENRNLYKKLNKLKVDILDPLQLY